MTLEERAKALVGDMPWVTERLTAAQLADLPKQVAACIHAAVAEEHDACKRVAYAMRDKAVAEEREACALVAQKAYEEDCGHARGITEVAPLIRARGEPRPPKGFALMVDEFAPVNHVADVVLDALLDALKPPLTWCDVLSPEKRDAMLRLLEKAKEHGGVTMEAEPQPDAIAEPPVGANTEMAHQRIEIMRKRLVESGREPRGQTFRGVSILEFSPDELCTLVAHLHEERWKDFDRRFPRRLELSGAPELGREPSHDV